MKTAQTKTFSVYYIHCILIPSRNCALFLTHTEMELNFFFALVSEAAGCALEVVQVVVVQEWKGKSFFFDPLSIVPTLTILFGRCREGPAGRTAVQWLNISALISITAFLCSLQDRQEKVIFPLTDLLWRKYYFVERTIFHLQEQQTRDSSQLP